MAFAEEFFLLRHDLFGTALQQRLPPVDVFHDAAGLVQLLRKIEAHLFIRRLEQQVAVIHAEIQRGQTAAVHLHFQLLVFPGQHQDIGRDIAQVLPAAETSTRAGVQGADQVALLPHQSLGGPRLPADGTIAVLGQLIHELLHDDPCQPVVACVPLDLQTQALGPVPGTHTRRVGSLQLRQGTGDHRVADAQRCGQLGGVLAEKTVIVQPVTEQLHGLQHLRLQLRADKLRKHKAGEVVLIAQIISHPGKRVPAAVFLVLALIVRILPVAGLQPLPFPGKIRVFQHLFARVGQLKHRVFLQSSFYIIPQLLHTHLQYACKLCFLGRRSLFIRCAHFIYLPIISGLSLSHPLL